jgi:hypothetical protein
MNFGTSTTVQANELISLGIRDTVNPTTTKPSSTFGFKMTNANSFNVNTYAGTVTLTTTDAAQLLSTSLSPSSNVALANINIVFTFTLAHSFPSAGVIYIYYPATVGYNSSSLA